jgi:hypothetical protein
MSIRNEIEPELMRKLAALNSVPRRNPEKEAQGLAAFIREAADFPPAITPQPKRRHIMWMHALHSIFTLHRKEHSPMLSTLMSIFLIVSMVIGGGGVTVAAAQNSQPDQPLYGIKLISEVVRIGLSTDPDQEIELALEFADRRAAEITAMLQNGSLPSQAVQSRYQNQLEQILQTALHLSDGQAVQALAQIQTHLQQQEQEVFQVQANGSPDIAAVKADIEQMLQERLQWVQMGLKNPAELRDQLRLRDQQQDQIRQRTSTPEVHPTNTAPGTGAGNPWTTGTPTPGSGYGPGPGPDPTKTCTPVGNNGSVPQSTQQQQNQPTQAGPQPTQKQQNQPTQDDPQPTQQQQNQSTQAGPQPTKASPQPTSGPGPGGKH